MFGINPARWLAGGVVAALVMAAVISAASPIAYPRMQRALEARGLALPADPLSFGVLVLGLTLLAGLLVVFYYAAARTRFGPGPRTAVIMGIAAWAGGPLIMSLILYAFGLFGWRMTAFGLVVDLVALVLGTIAGAAVYRESESVAQQTAVTA